jgi:hypothetical protein
MAPLPLRHLVLFLISLAFACSSAPGAPGESTATTTHVDVPAPRTPPPMSAPLPAWLSGAVLSAHAAGGVAAYDSASGALRAHVLPGEFVHDLAWEPATGRLLVAFALREADGGRVVALLPTETGLVQSAESPNFDGELRLMPDAVGTLLVNHFEASSWQLLDAALVPRAPGRALVTPAGLRAFLGPGGRAWLALDTNGYADDVYQDALVRVEHGGARFSTEPLAFAAQDRPQTRFIRGDGAATWLARKHDAASWLEYGSYDFEVPQVPEFERVELGAAFGPLVDAIVVPPTRSFALLLGGADTRVVSIAKGQEVSSEPVPGAASPDALFPRKMAWHESSQRLWVATELGLTALAATKSGLSQVAHLPDARGPLVTIP